MKQLLSLALALIPCLAWAQYPSNGNQKITLGEQTTADGLFFRGVAATDTVRKPSIDTMAYMVLDTTTNIIWHYKKATSNAWLRLNLLPSDTASMLTNYLRSGVAATTYQTKLTNPVTGTGTTNYIPKFTGSTAIGNSQIFDNGTQVGIGTTSPATKLHIAQSSSAVLFSESSGVATIVGTNAAGNASQGLFLRAFPLTFTGNGEGGAEHMRLDASGNLIVGGTSPAGRFRVFSANTNSTGLNDVADFTNAVDVGLRLQITGTSETDKRASLSTTTTSAFAFGTNGSERMRITSAGEVWIGYTTDQGNYRLQIQDSVYVGGNVSAAAYTTRSDYNLKDDIFNLKYGLNDILQLEPVEYTYKSNGSKQLGFIAQDIGTILPEVVSFEESMSVNYQAIIPILTKAIQEQTIIIKQLEERIKKLEER